MTITDKTTTPFSSVPGGGCFAYGDHFFVKLKTDVRVEWSKNLANALTLNNGDPIHFADTIPVFYLPRARIETE